VGCITAFCESEENVKLQDHITWQTQQTPPVDCGGASLVLEARTLIVSFHRGGFVWNSPTAAVVERNGNVERIPIVDVTRRAVWAFAAISTLFGLLALIFGSSMK
jgi:hypothetical protein